MDVAYIPQQHVEIDVAFYDAAERDKLQRFPTAQEINAVVASPVAVSTSEFLTYYLFHKKRLGIPGYRDYASVGTKLNKALEALEETVLFTGHSIATAPNVGRQLTEVTERLGEAVGLSIMNRIHGMTEADWIPILERRGPNASPSFDYELGTDGSRIVEVENKGSSSLDNRVISDAVRTQKAKISEKKRSMGNRESQGGNVHEGTLRYGTIGVVDPRLNGRVKCWLTDPEPEGSSWPPAKLRLLARQYFLFDAISFVSPRSQLAAALATRIAILERLENANEIDGVPLRKANNENFVFESPNSLRPHASFFLGKSRVEDGPAGGVVLQLSEKRLLFAGIMQEVLELAANQNHEAILKHRRQSGAVTKMVRCIVGRRRFDRMGIAARLGKRVTSVGANVSFSLPGQLHYSPGGLVFGVLELRNEESSAFPPGRPGLERK